MLLLALVSIFIIASCKQEGNKPVPPVKQEIKDNVRYKMFPTENIWTFLKLDTRNGKIWQVQYSINDNYRGEIELNDKALVSENIAENGRFTLYPTKNMYNFILLDQIDGKMWQVQWSTAPENRGILPIFNHYTENYD